MEKRANNKKDMIIHFSEPGSDPQIYEVTRRASGVLRLNGFRVITDDTPSKGMSLRVDLKKIGDNLQVCFKAPDGKFEHITRFSMNSRKDEEIAADVLTEIKKLLDKNDSIQSPYSSEEDNLIREQLEKLGYL